MKTNLIIYFLLILILTNTAYSLQDNPFPESSFIDIPISAKYLGMGGAKTALFHETFSQRSNPAMLINLKYNSIASLNDKLTLDREHSFTGIGIPIGEKSSLAVSYEEYEAESLPRTEDDLTKIIGYTSDNNPIYDTIITGYFVDREFRSIVSFATPLTKKLSIGTNLKYMAHKVDYLTGNGYGFDLGFYYQDENQISLGLFFENLVGKINYANGLNTREFPLLTNLGVAWTPFEKWSFALDITQPYKGNTIFKGGAEYSIGSFFTLRAGINDSKPSVGFSFNYKDSSTDYAYIDGDMGETHLVSSTFKFGGLYSRNKRDKENKKSVIIKGDPKKINELDRINPFFDPSLDPEQESHKKEFSRNTPEKRYYDAKEHKKPFVLFDIDYNKKQIKANGRIIENYNFTEFDGIIYFSLKQILLAMDLDYIYRDETLEVLVTTKRHNVLSFRLGTSMIQINFTNDPVLLKGEVKLHKGQILVPFIQAVELLKKY